MVCDQFAQGRSTSKKRSRDPANKAGVDEGAADRRYEGEHTGNWFKRLRVLQSTDLSRAEIRPFEPGRNQSKCCPDLGVNDVTTIAYYY